MSDQNAIIPQKEKHPLLVMLENQSVMQRFEQASPGMSGKIIVNIINAANENPTIWECEPVSVVNAALQASVMNLSLSKSLGQSAIIPYEDHKTGKKRASFIPMVRGIKKLALKTNQYRYLNAFSVREGQEMVENQMTGIFMLRGTAKSKRVIGFGAYLQLFNGFEASVYWTIDDILHRGQRSKSWNRQQKTFKPGSLWADQHRDDQHNYDGDGFTAMAFKTVMKDLILNHGVLDERDRESLSRNDEETSGMEMIGDHEVIDVPVSEVPDETGETIDPGPEARMATATPDDLRETYEAQTAGMTADQKQERANNNIKQLGFD